MPTRSSKPAPRPRLDLNQLAKRILDEATGEAPKTAPPPVKNAAAVALGKLGGQKGGAARASKLSPDQRTAIAKTAAKADAKEMKTDAKADASVAKAETNAADTKVKAHAKAKKTKAKAHAKAVKAEAKADAKAEAAPAK